MFNLDELYEEIQNLEAAAQQAKEASEDENRKEAFHFGRMAVNWGEAAVGAAKGALGLTKGAVKAAPREAAALGSMFALSNILGRTFRPERTGKGAPLPWEYASEPTRTTAGRIDVARGTAVSSLKNIKSWFMPAKITGEAIDQLVGHDESLARAVHHIAAQRRFGVFGKKEEHLAKELANRAHESPHALKFISRTLGIQIHPNEPLVVKHQKILEAVKRHGIDTVRDRAVEVIHQMAAEKGIKLDPAHTRYIFHLGRAGTRLGKIKRIASSEGLHALIGAGVGATFGWMHAAGQGGNLFEKALGAVIGGAGGGFIAQLMSPAARFNLAQAYLQAKDRAVMEGGPAAADSFGTKVKARLSQAAALLRQAAPHAAFATLVGLGIHSAHSLAKKAVKGGRKRRKK